MSSNLLRTEIFLALMIVAIIMSRKKWRTLFFILGWSAAGFALGAGIGFGFGSPSAAGTAAALATQWMGIGASISRIIVANKQKKEVKNHENIPQSRTNPNVGENRDETTRSAQL